MPYITDAAREYAKKKLTKDSNERFFDLLTKNQKRSKSEQYEFKQLFRPLSFEELLTKGKTIFDEIMSNDVGGHDLPLRQLFNAGQSNKLSSSDYKLIDNAFNNGMTFNEIINQFDRLAKDKWEFNPNMYEGLNVNQSPFSADAIAKIKNILKKGYNAYRQFKVHQTTKDTVKEYAKKNAKDDDSSDEKYVKYHVTEIFNYINDKLRHGTYQFNVTASYSSLYATFDITIQNVTIYYADNEKSNSVRFNFTVDLHEDTAIGNIHVYSFDAFVGKTVLGHLHHFNDTTLSKIFSQIDAFITSASHQTQSQVQEKDITTAAEMLFALASLMNNYLDKSHKLAKKCEAFMTKHNIVGGPGDFALDSARFDFDDEILDIKSIDDAINYIKNSMT